VENLEKLKVAIITEGFLGTGYGHLTRCLSIYQAFEEKGINPIYIANCDDNGKKFLPNVKLLQIDWINEIDKVILTISNFDLIVIDSYLAPIEIYLKIYEVSKKVIYIDDFLRLSYPPGIIVNGTINSENLQYKRDKNHTYLLGINFMPIRKVFWDIQIPNRNHDIKNVLLTFGAQDPRRLTAKILDFLLSKFPDYNYSVVAGEISENVLNLSNVVYFDSVDSKDMLKLMLENDFTISAAGQTIYELARVGMPTIAIGVADNQKFNIKGWIESNFINEEIWYNDERIFEKIENNMKITKIPRNLIDGQGARRIIESALL